MYLIYIKANERNISNDANISIGNNCFEIFGALFSTNNQKKINPNVCK